MYFILNYLNEDKSENNCSLVSFDYEGKLIDNISFKDILQNKLSINSEKGIEGKIDYFDNHGNSREKYPDTFGAEIKIDPSGKYFYSFGNFDDRKNKKNSVSGFYVFKYDFKGNLIWKMEKNNITDIKTKGYSILEDYSNLVILNNGKIGFWSSVYNTDYASFCTLNSENGEVLKTKNLRVGIQGIITFSRKKGSTGLIKSYNYINDSAVKTFMNSAALFAYCFNENIEKYILSKKGNRFAAYICPEGIYLMEENEESNNLKLMKFDL